MPACRRRQGQGGKFAGLPGGVQREKVTAPGGAGAPGLADHAARWGVASQSQGQVHGQSQESGIGVHGVGSSPASPSEPS
jgi:hypothetical protein